jgi:hypothetical protein
MRGEKMKKYKGKHTPAPWEFSEHTVMGGPTTKNMKHEWKNKVCDVTAHDTVTGLLTEKERVANGRLIQTAPEMFDFLVDILPNLCDKDRERAEMILDKATKG